VDYNVVKRVFSFLRQHFRRKRYKQIQALINIESTFGFILDLGGGPASFFAAMFPRPEQIILVDINEKLAGRAKKIRPEMHIIVADAGRLPLANQSINTTVSNSVIEHVDAPDRLAEEILRVSLSYFLQTPNGDFPLETHSFIAIPFYNYMPWVWLRRYVCKLFRANFDYVSSVGYLSETTLRQLFPEAVVHYERMLWLTKSFYIHHRLPDES
jgi:ubiquinone/menaquinone biosynthesis C-methylase UbiE